MSKARICVCGHNTTDHHQPYKKKNRTHCLWIDCKCKKFKFKELRSPNEGLKKYYEELPTLIDAAQNHGQRIFDKPPPNPPKLLVSECGSDGKHNEFKKVYNNGEYP